ncbi:hypothetical protein L7G72_12780 [Xenorhabdus bovienii]|uniref:hypothetical protein n=1 Tax=Xenorhabdus bovienii TaxID=40576 RepID=UPI001EE13BE6|nr:hypothetical protein [Xenorhabdus bovienii]MCG3462715.1 hypothetical protein [Xenorhabdus bovienii]
MNSDNGVVIQGNFSRGDDSMSNISANDRHLSDNHSSLKNGNGGGGGGGGMESRVAKLESDVEHIKTTMNDMKSDLKTVTGDVGAIKTEIAIIKSNYATKADVTSSANKIILWVAGAVVFSQLLPAIPKIIEMFVK